MVAADSANVFLGIDCGTQGTKALLVTESGKPLGRGYAPHQIIERSNGAREQEASWWVDAMIASVQQALRQSAGHDAGAAFRVKALGISGQQHGLVVLDEAMKVIRPAKLWNDTETAPQNDQLLERLGGQQAWFDRFGVVPRTGYTVSKLLWIAQQHPDDFARIRHILLPHEYLNWWLTGVLRAEPGDASGTGFYDNRSRTWAHDVLAAIDGGTGQLAAALPPLMRSDEPVGTVLPQAAAKLDPESIHLDAGCLVSAGGGDNMMGAIGTGNVRPGVVTLSLGTSSTVYSFQEQPTDDSTGNVAPFCSSSGGWLPLVCTMNATNVVTATCALLGKTVHDIEQALADTPAGADGLVFLPFLNGERTPDLPNARGTLSGISAVNFTPSHMIRAAVEGVSFGILAGLDRILEGRSADLIQVIGGGARSAGWRQLLADATGARVTTPAEQESGCLGAAIQAFVCVQTAAGHPANFTAAVEQFKASAATDATQPSPAQRAGYDQARARYAAQLKALYPSA